MDERKGGVTKPLPKPTVTESGWGGEIAKKHPEVKPVPQVVHDKPIWEDEVAKAKKESTSGS